MNANKFSILEANTQLLDGGAMFGNCPKEVWKTWMSSDEKNRIPLACRVLLLQTHQGKNILFEAGIGAFFEPKLKVRYGVCEEEHLLLKRLEELGFKETDIDAVVLSHLHFDHAGGLLPPYPEKQDRLLFPKATYYVPSKHWLRANVPHVRERMSFIPTLNALLKDSGRLRLVEGDRFDVLGEMIELSYSDGHSIGLMIMRLQTDSGPLILTSDLIPGTPWIHLPITMGYDRFPELIVDEKKKLLDECIKTNAKLFFTHDSKVPMVKVTQDSSGRYVGVQSLSYGSAM